MIHFYILVLSDEQLGVLLDRSDLSNAEGSDRGMFQVLNFSS